VADYFPKSEEIVLPISEVESKLLVSGASDKRRGGGGAMKTMTNYKGYRMDAIGSRFVVVNPRNEVVFFGTLAQCKQFLAKRLAVLPR
jgi:hypothetical protein